MRFWHSLIADCIIGKFLDFWSNGKTCDIFHSMDRTEWMGCIPARIYIHPGQALVFVCLCLSHMKRNWRPNRDLFVGQNGKVFFFFFWGGRRKSGAQVQFVRLVTGSWLGVWEWDRERERKRERGKCCELPASELGIRQWEKHLAPSWLASFVGLSNLTTLRLQLAYATPSATSSCLYW